MLERHSHGPAGPRLREVPLEDPWGTPFGGDATPPEVSSVGEETHATGEEGLPDRESRTSHDGLGVPWYRPASSGTQRHFIHAFLTPKAVAADGSGYDVQRKCGVVQYSLSMRSSECERYPPPTYDRRLTLNNWGCLLTESMLLAGLRLAALQANLQVIMAMVDNPVYEDVPRWLWLVNVAALAVAVILWTAFGAQSAYCYREFLHPDSRFRRAMAFVSSTLLVMFAISNDVTLCPIHVLPIERGGLLCESACIEGNMRWPVLTIAHSSKPDHDYTNRAGISVQLPVFLLVDIGCTVLNVTVAYFHGIFNYTALVQMSLCGAYAIGKLYEALNRWRLRHRLHHIWLKTIRDPLMSEGRRAAAKKKYVAEGGRVSTLKHTSSMIMNSEYDHRTSSKPDETTGDSLHVPWYKPTSEDDLTPAFPLRFVHAYYLNKEVSPDGQYTPKKHDRGGVQYSLTSASGDGNCYPPPTFDRRVTLNNWQEMLFNCMMEAGFRNAGIQANVMMAAMMIENPLYENMSWGLWIAFVAMLGSALILWPVLAARSVNHFLPYFHPDSRWKRCKALVSSVLLSMFAIPNDVQLFPIHMAPIEKGGLLCESGCIEAMRKWPAHTVAHNSKLDHDYINTLNVPIQLPLFLLLDIGCTATNLMIALEVGVFNFTSLLQMCTCGAYAFVKLFQIFMRLQLRRKLLPMWLRTAHDPHMTESRRIMAIDKYLAAGGRQSKIRETTGVSRASSVRRSSSRRTIVL